MDVRSRLTYANVVATLALFLALAGGTVFAAVQLGKNDVKSENIAPGEVKASDLGKNAVSSGNVKNGSIAGADLSAAVFKGLDTDVAGTATSGAVGGLDTNTTVSLPLKGKTTFKPKAGEVAALAAEGQWTTASTNAANYCQPAVFLFVNGVQTRVFVEPGSEGNQTALETSLGRDADGPFGLIDPGAPLQITAQIRGDADCTPDSQLDRLIVRIVQIR